MSNSLDNSLLNVRGHSCDDPAISKKEGAEMYQLVSSNRSINRQRACDLAKVAGESSLTLAYLSAVARNQATVTWLER